MLWIVKFPLRVVNAIIAFWWYWMEVAADFCIRIFVKTEYERKGKCKSCGMCCRYLGLALPSWIARRPKLIRIFNWWHDTVLNFEFLGMHNNWLVYTCRYLESYNPCRSLDGVKKMDVLNKCKIYRFRHKLCRLYPRQKLYGYPKLHKDCGFSFHRRDGKPSFDDILRRYYTN